MTSAYRSISTKRTPQSEPLPGQVANSAGGHAWAVDDWTRLDRFLILGSEGGTYYIDAPKLTRENADAVQRCIVADGPKVVARIVEVSLASRAPKNEPAIFALAMALKLGDVATRRKAAGAVSSVCRIGTHLFHLAAYIEQFGGWGPLTRRAVRDWYLAKPLDELGYQVVKYVQRDGWSHRDLLRLSHPKDKERQGLFHWITQNDGETGVPLVEVVRRLGDVEAAALPTSIREHRIPRECLPTEALNRKDVWAALLDDMPMTAMIRNLAKMTSVGLLKPASEAVGKVVSALKDEERIRKARVHPLQMLVAQRIYAGGKGHRGSLEWTPVPQVVDALDEAFYFAFGNVKATGKRLLLALDVSGSMGYHAISDSMPITAAEGAAAMAMVTARTEPNYIVMGFADEFRNLPLSPKQRLDDVLRMTSIQNFGRTDCALPMIWALKQGMAVDAFIVYTDNETWAGDIHPAQALQEYRRQTGLPAKLIVVGMCSNEFSIADPADGGMMDVVGFDTAAPNVMADFIGRD